MVAYFQKQNKSIVWFNCVSFWKKLYARIYFLYVEKERHKVYSTEKIDVSINSRPLWLEEATVYMYICVSVTQPREDLQVCCRWGAQVILYKVKLLLKAFTKLRLCNTSSNIHRYICTYIHQKHTWCYTFFLWEHYMCAACSLYIVLLCVWWRI